MLLAAFFLRSTLSAEEIQAPRRRVASCRDNFCIGDDIDCVLTDFSWEPESWSPFAGILSFTVPESAEDFLYVLKSNDPTKEIGAIWWPDGEPLENGDVGQPTKNGDFWVLDPRSTWFNWATSLHHWINFDVFDASLSAPNPASEMELYYCYAPAGGSRRRAPDPVDRRRALDKTLYHNSDSLAETVAAIAAFLAQANHESAAFKACDEANHSGSATPGCTQREDGALYQDVDTGPHACNLTAINGAMNITAVTGAPWDATIAKLECTQGTATESCCWWGRGALQTTGPTNYGALQNDVIEKRVPASTLDLCEDPELICTEDDLKWTSGVYYWVTEVQEDSCFDAALKAYVENYDETAVSGTCASFINGVGGKINNGAWSSTAHGNANRVQKFKDYMVAVKAAVEKYDAVTACPAECTGNTAVDYVLSESNLQTKAGINAAGSVYTWSGLCTALKEFWPDA